MSTTTLVERIEHLSSSKRQFIEKIIEAWTEAPKDGEKHFTFSWAGGLADFRNKYTSLELKKEILNLWMPKP